MGERDRGGMWTLTADMSIVSAVNFARCARRPYIKVFVMWPDRQQITLWNARADAAINQTHLRAHV